MEDYQIKDQIEVTVENWIKIQLELDYKISISPKAKDFLVEVISNIQQDSSRYWTEKNNFDSAQREAISLVPIALNEVLRYYRPKDKKHTTIKITTWEIWHVISPILNRWCFMPKTI